MNTLESTITLSTGLTVTVAYEMDGYEPLIVAVECDGLDIEDELTDDESYELYNAVCDEVVNYKVGNV